MPTIGDLLRSKGSEVVTGTPDQTVREAIEKLVKYRIGCLLIQDARGGVAGIVTERDVLRIVRDHADRIGEATVSEFMTTDLVCGVPDDDLDYVMATMTKNRFRRMPVVEGGRLVGIVSIGDVVRALKSAREYENRQLRDYIAGGYA